MEEQEASSSFLCWQRSIVEEEEQKGSSIGDQIGAALFHAVYLALKNDHPTTALTIVGVLLCEWVRSRVSGGGSCSPTSLLLLASKQGEQVASKHCWRRPKAISSPRWLVRVMQ